MIISEACKQFLEHCQYNRKLSTHSIKAYKQDLTSFLLAIEEQDIKAFDKKQLKDYVNHLYQKDLSARTIKRRIACLKSMFRWLELDDLIENNPFHKVDVSVKLPNLLPRNIPTTNLRKMLKSLRTNLNLTKEDGYSLVILEDFISTPKRVNKLTSLLAVELLFSTGIRVCELVDIEISNIYLSEKKIKILGKGQRERFVFLPNKEVTDLIISYIILRKITRPTHDYFLVNSRGNPASTQFIRKLLRQASLAANIEKITPHMYRHSAACQLLESGVDIRFVQRLLGHQSILTTQLYTHVNDSALQKRITKANTRSTII